MKILRTRMIAFYPHLLLEAEAEKENGQKTYVNVSLPFNAEEISELLDDAWWSYSKPLHEVNFEDDTDVDYDKECEIIAHELVKIWNNDPHFKETEGAWYGKW